MAQKLPFTNAQAMARRHPATFSAPTIAECSAVRVGQYVKVSAGTERFWVLITEHDKGAYTGTVANDLIDTDVHGIKSGDLVHIDYEQVYDII